MFWLHQGRFPSIICPITGETVVIFADNAAGFSRCMEILRDVKDEIADVLAMADAMS